MVDVDWAALWEAGGPLAVAMVGLLAVLVVLVARMMRIAPPGLPAPDPTAAAIERLSVKVENLNTQVTDRLARVETKQDNFERELSGAIQEMRKVKK